MKRNGTTTRTRGEDEDRPWTSSGKSAGKTYNPGIGGVFLLAGRIASRSLGLDVSGESLCRMDERS